MDLQRYGVRGFERNRSGALRLIYLKSNDVVIQRREALHSRSALRGEVAQAKQLDA